MNNFKFRAKDIVALVVILGYIITAWRGVATMLSSATLVIVGYYFARRDETDHKEPPKK